MLHGQEMSKQTKVNRENTGQTKMKTPEKQKIEYPQVILHQNMALIFLVDFVYTFRQLGSNKYFIVLAIHTRFTEARIQYYNST